MNMSQVNRIIDVCDQLDTIKMELKKQLMGAGWSDSALLDLELTAARLDYLATERGADEQTRSTT